MICVKMKLLKNATHLCLTQGNSLVNWDRNVATVTITLIAGKTTFQVKVQNIKVKIYLMINL